MVLVVVYIVVVVVLGLSSLSSLSCHSMITTTTTPESCQGRCRPSTPLDIMNQCTRSCKRRTGGRSSNDVVERTMEASCREHHSIYILLLSFDEDEGTVYFQQRKKSFERAIIFHRRQIWRLSYNLATPSWPSQCITKGFYFYIYGGASPVFVDYAHIKFTRIHYCHPLGQSSLVVSHIYMLMCNEFFFNKKHGAV